MENTFFDIAYQIGNTDFAILFHDVQFSGLFPDSKTFTDCTAKHEIDIIVTDYLAKKNNEDFDLQDFIFKNFDLPLIPETGFISDSNKSIASHIKSLWPVLTVEKTKPNGTYLPLPKPFIVPGGRFQELYYWDSYFTCLGLLENGHIQMIENLADNFAYLIDTFGHIPNGNRSYFLSRSQPPVFALIVALLSKQKGKKMLAKYLPAMHREYAFWMDGESELNETKVAVKRVVNVGYGNVLNRYWDNLDTPRPESYKEDIELAENLSDSESKILCRNIRAAAESGWDFSTRWFADGQNMSTIQTIDLLPVDLNCLLYFLENTISEACKFNNDIEKAILFQAKAEKRKDLIQKIFWQNDFFYDYNFVKKGSAAQATLAACFPLFFKIATAEQAEFIALKLEKQFLKVGGLVTTLTDSGQQWDAPNGWAPLQWLGFQGLVNYGFDELAEKIRTNWLQRVGDIYKKEGKLTEKYNVVSQAESGGGGEYPNQDGFGWTNGVTLKFLSLDIV